MVRHGILLALTLGTAASAQELARLPADLRLHTRFGAQVPALAPRPEYPRPHCVRDRWQSLNGSWEFSARTEGPYEEQIRVPFAPETALSGLFWQQRIVERCRYRKRFTLPAEWVGGEVMLHFEAVDWEARVVLDGTELGVHRGGYDRFSFPIRAALAGGTEHVLEVHVYDPADPKVHGFQPRGKQLGSEGIWYTRTTGIWRPVWLEPVPEPRIAHLDLRADHEGRLRVAVGLEPAAALPPGWQLRGLVSGVGRGGGRLHQEFVHGLADEPPLERVRDVQPWSPEQPALYELELELRDPTGKRGDRVTSYVAFRTVSIADGRWCLNGEPYFLRGVLDQGYWPESGLTAPSDAALRHDVQLVKDLGLNLARKHVKVEDARWYSWCDRLGVLVMQDMPSSMNLATEAARAGFKRELEAMVRQLQASPAVVHWVVFNEDWGRPGAFQDECVQRVRQLDPTRPVTDASGWTQRENTDVTDVHDYGADLLRHAEAKPLRPKLLGECGGVAFSREGHVWTKGWGYTQAATPASFLRRVQRLAHQAVTCRGLSGFVWTQLTDVEQELNGFVHYDRSEKVPLAELAKMLSGNEPLPERISPAQWRCFGPFDGGTRIADSQDSEANRKALETLLGRSFAPEAALLAPGPAEALPGGKVATPRAHGVDLLTVFGGAPANCAAYAAGTVRVAQPRSMRLLFGSDDAAEVWINGKSVHRQIRVRGARLGDDEVPAVALVAGDNQIVVKVAQGMFGFGFALCFEAE